MGGVRAAEHPETGGRLDSATAHYHLPEILVTANRFPTLRDESPAPLSIITDRDLNTVPGIHLASSIAGLPGTFVRPYGGGGALQTVSFRGMSAEHTVLIVDDQRVNSVQNGQADLGILSRFNVERVEVIRGGNSALYGADAMGGVVRAFTKRPTQDLTLHASLGIGSAGLLSRELGLSGSISGLGLLLAVRTEKGNGRYPYRYAEGNGSSLHERLGADHTILEGVARLTWLVQSDLETDLAFTGIDADRGVPGPVLRPDDPGGARLSDRNLRLSWATRWRASKGLTARLGASFHGSDQRYGDPTINLGAQGLLGSTSELEVYRISPEIEHTIAQGIDGAGGIELQRAHISATNIGDTERRQWAVWYSGRIVEAVGGDVLSEVGIFPSLRYDWFSDFGEAWSPKLGVNIVPVRALPLRIRASYAQSFRAPTFNELYWIPGGNPTLRPERSTALDGGLIVKLPLEGDLRLEAGFFSGETQDRILWLPGPGSVWSPENVGLVTNRGVELEGEWLGFGGILGLSVNSTWTNARKASESAPGDPTTGNQLIYVPEQTINASVAVHAGMVEGRIEHSWVSFRYTSEANDQLLPSYAVTSALAQVQLPLGASTLTVRGEINNIFNEAYEVMPQYPMPLRGFILSFGVDL